MNTTNSIPTFWQSLRNWICNLIGCPENSPTNPNPPGSVAGFRIDNLNFPSIPHPYDSANTPRSPMTLLDVLEYNINATDSNELQVLGWFIDYQGNLPDVSPTNVHQLLYRKGDFETGLNRFFIIPASYPLPDNYAPPNTPWSELTIELSYSHYLINQVHEYSNLLVTSLQKVSKSMLEFEDEKTDMCFFSASQLMLIKDLIRENRDASPEVIFSGYETHYGRLASPLNSDKLSVNEYPRKRKTNNWFALKAEIILQPASSPENPAPSTYQNTQGEVSSMAPFSALGHSCPPTWDTNASAIDQIALEPGSNVNQFDSRNSSASPTYTDLLLQLDKRISDYLSTGKLTDPWGLPDNGSGHGN